MKSLIIGSMIFIVFTLLGCNSSDTSKDATVSMDVTVLDGYIKSATVTDNNGQIAVENNVSKGLYTFVTTPVYPIRSTGGIIIDTNETYDINMIAYSGHVISPVSTFIGNDDNLTNNLKKSLGFHSKDELLDDYITSNSLPLAKVSALLYAVLKDASFKQAFQNRLKAGTSDDLFADAIEDSSSSPEGFLTYINDLASFNSDVKDLETFLKNDKNNLVPLVTVIYTPPSQPHPVNNILLAHGLQMSSSKKYNGKVDWDVWVDYLKEKGWNAFYCNDNHNASIMESESNASDKNVYRCSVTGDASIETRATQLAQYINTLKVPNDSITAVGHSMGGLDLHYIISKGHEEPDSIFYTAAKKIHKVYTLASPHKGNMFAGTVFSPSPAVEDLGLKQMQQFNKDHPYTTFEIDNRKIDLMALRFECSDGFGADGVVSVQNQILNGAPHSKHIYIGKHMSGKITSECESIKREQDQSDAILNDIIIENKKISSEIHDIVFYEGDNCSGDEKGVFSSSHKVDKKCERLPISHNDSCDNDEIRSVKIFPSVAKGTIIKLYDNPDGNLNDDSIFIYRGNHTLSSPVCIKNLEHDTYSEESKKGIHTYYRDHNGLNGKVSRVRITTKKSDEIAFFEGNGCTQQVKGNYYSSDGDIDVNCKESDKCDNDEIRSVLMFPGVTKNTVITLYNNKEGTDKDDWFYIDRGDHTLDVPYCIHTLERDQETDSRDVYFHYYEVTHWYDVGKGLDGKVSHITVED